MWLFSSDAENKHGCYNDAHGDEENGVRTSVINQQAASPKQSPPTALTDGISGDNVTRNDLNSSYVALPATRRKSQRGIIYFRSILPSDRPVIQSLHEEWFPVDYKNDFFDALCNERVMPGTGEPLHCCVACFKQLNDAEFEEIKENSVQERSMGLLWSQKKFPVMKSDLLQKEGIGDFILWETEHSDEESNDNNHSQNGNNIEQKTDEENGQRKNPLTKTLPLLSTTTPPSYCAPTTTTTCGNNLKSLEKIKEMHVHQQREQMRRFYSNGFRFDGDDESETSSFSKTNHELMDNQHGTESGERIVGCLVGSFLPSNTPSKQTNNSLDDDDPRDETCKLLIPNPDRHTRMFYIMTLGTAVQFRRAGLGSVLVDRVVDMINAMPECGALYLHVITYNAGAIRLYERLGFSKVNEIVNYYSINDVNYNCFLYARYFNGNRGHKTIYDVIYDFASSILKNVIPIPWRR